ncbi:MAG: DUF4860 domain-containing protein [Atopobiaceae bacterium]|nr:DUF4860 domain-containing protein [Atopobiaceae bacterium]
MSNKPSISVMDALTSSARHGSTQDNRLGRAFSVLLFMVFVIADMLALVAGASAYGSLTAMQNKNDQEIMTVGPLVSSVRANDTHGSVRKTMDGPEGEALVLVSNDASGTYETRIYLYQNNIVQEYALAGAHYTPSKATVLAKSSTFSFEYHDGLLFIHTDAGTTKVALRNMQGGA